MTHDGHVHGGAGWDDARRLLHSLGRPAAETVPVDVAVGRVTLEAVRAPRAVPHYVSSAMDGWVVAGDGPWRLVAGSGSHRAGPALAPGTAAPVLTGGALPEGATDVVRTEHGDVTGGVLRKRANPGDGERMRRDIRPAAEEAEAGEVLVPPGRRLGPFDVALLSTAGVDAVAVARRPLAAVFVTGDEVIGGGLPEAGQVRDAFSRPIHHLLAAWGAEPRVTGVIPDSPARLSRAFDEADRVADSAGAPGPRLVVTTGGTAHSSSDLLRTATIEAGYEPVLDGVALRPGRHTLVARRPGTDQWVACLPGNPLAAFCALVIVVEPLLAGLLGLPFAEPARATLLTDSASEVARITPVVLGDAGARPLPFRSAYMLRGLAAADALAIQPAGTRPGPVAAPLFPLPR